MADMLKKVPVREQDAKVRATNFEEVCYGYNQEEAMEEASRCLNCKNAKCIQGCPVSINIPGFISKVKEGDIEGGLPGYRRSPQHFRLSAVVYVLRNPSANVNVSAGSRENRYRSVSWKDLWQTMRWSTISNRQKAEKTNGHKVAVIGSGPSGLTCAGDLAKLGYEVTVFEALHELGGVLVYGIP